MIWFCIAGDLFSGPDLVSVLFWFLGFVFPSNLFMNIIFFFLFSPLDTTFTGGYNILFHLKQIEFNMFFYFLCLSFFLVQIHDSFSFMPDRETHICFPF